MFQEIVNIILTYIQIYTFRKKMIEICPNTERGLNMHLHVKQQKKCLIMIQTT